MHISFLFLFLFDDFSYPYSLLYEGGFCDSHCVRCSGTQSGRRTAFGMNVIPCKNQTQCRHIDRTGALWRKKKWHKETQMGGKSVLFYRHCSESVSRKNLGTSQVDTGGVRIQA